MPVGKRVTKVVLGIVIAGILLGYVFPVGISAVNEDPTYNVTLDEGTETVIQEDLNATATTVNTTNDEATIEVKQVSTGTTASATIANGTNHTFTSLEGGNVTVAVTDTTAGTPNTVDATFTVAQGFAWDGSTQTIFNILGLFLVLVPLIVLAKMAMDA